MRQDQEALQFNGNAALSGTSIELTDGGTNEAGSAFYAAPVNIQTFTTDFVFQLTNANADGFTFTIQNGAPTALGASGGSLGYAGIGASVAVKFDLYNNAGDGPNSTGIYVDGAPPNVPAIDLTSSGINLHSGDKMDAHIAYDGTTLTLTITDLVTMATFSHPFMVNIPAAVGANTAYIGFTGGTGGPTAVQQILNWSYQPGQAINYPGFPSASGLTANGSASLSATSMKLTNGGLYETGSVFSDHAGEYPVLQHRFQIQDNQPRRRRLHVYDSEYWPHGARIQRRLRWDMGASAIVWRSSSTSSKIPGTPRMTRPAFLSMGPFRLGRPPST